MYLNRDPVCLQCHNSEFSVTQSANPETNRHFPVPALLEKALFGESTGVPATKNAETTDRMTRIVKTMRGFVRKDEAATNSEAVRLKAVINDAIELCQGKLRHAGAVLEIPEIPLDFAVVGNHSEILQVLLNSICNSIEAVETQNERWVRLGIVEADKILEIQISDSGPGIPKEVREHMTEAFFTTKVSGTGLGLSICRMIAERHRGDLVLVPDGAPGARFRLTLPTQPPR